GSPAGYARNAKTSKVKSQQSTQTLRRYQPSTRVVKSFSRRQKTGWKSSRKTSGGSGNLHQTRRTSRGSNFARDGRGVKHDAKMHNERMPPAGDLGDRDPPGRSGVLDILRLRRALP